MLLYCFCPMATFPFLFSSLLSFFFFLFLFLFPFLRSTFLHYTPRIHISIPYAACSVHYYMTSIPWYRADRHDWGTAAACSSSAEVSTGTLGSSVLVVVLLLTLTYPLTSSISLPFLHPSSAPTHPTHLYPRTPSKTDMCASQFSEPVAEPVL